MWRRGDDERARDGYGDSGNEEPITLNRTGGRNTFRGAWNRKQIVLLSVRRIRSDQDCVFAYLSVNMEERLNVTRLHCVTEVTYCN